MRRWIILSAAVIACLAVPAFLFDSTVHAQIVSIASVCLLLWISGAVPPFVPTLLLWAAVPLLLGRADPGLQLSKVLGWAADPVVALFFGGFVLGAAAEKSGLAGRVMGYATRRAGNSYRTFLLLVILITAFLSMWMSNIAAAALSLACLHPVLARMNEDDIFRRMLLIGIALGADFGGIATPIGTGPNAIAIASVSGQQPVSFVMWMAFALPLTIGMIAASYLLLLSRLPKDDRGWDAAGSDVQSTPHNNQEPIKASRRFEVLLAATIIFWLTEPLHGIGAGVVSLAAAFAVFTFRFLNKEDLSRIDWSTLMLIMGGITLGRLLEHSGMVHELSRQIPFQGLHPVLGTFVICLVAATLSALMSNTATAVLIIPIATALFPEPSTPILIAVAASFGVPFIISTPPNAMAFGEGGLRFGDLFWPGIVLMIGGCMLIAVTGRPILSWAGIG